MSISEGMPCHITAMGDEFDNHDSVEIDEEKEIAIIQEALLNGDRFNTFGSHIVDFSNVVDDELCCNAEFGNALRKLMIGDTRQAVKEIRAVVNKEACKIAELIYMERAAKDE